MWSISPEHYHPLIVHFPVALWPTALLLYLASFVSPLKGLRGAALVCGVVGSVMGWIAILTGEKAAQIVGAGVCDGALLDAHAEQAETAFLFLAVTWGFLALSALVRRRWMGDRPQPWWLELACLAALGLGTTYLTLAGHKGHRLVYEEGTAVAKPGACSR